MSELYLFPISNDPIIYGDLEAEIKFTLGSLETVLLAMQTYPKFLDFRIILNFLNG